MTIVGIYVIGSIFSVEYLNIPRILFFNIVTYIGVAFGIYIAINRIRP